MFSVLRVKVNATSSGMREYLADYASDVTALPTWAAEGTQSGSDNDEFNNKKCMPGSTCFVTEDSTTWILNNQNEWIQKANTGSSGSNTDSYTATTSEDVLALFGWSRESEEEG